MVRTGSVVFYESMFTINIYLIEIFNWSFCELCIFPIVQKSQAKFLAFYILHYISQEALRRHLIHACEQTLESYNLSTYSHPLNRFGLCVTK